MVLYKEVLEYYEDGLEIPDDVTLVFPDDNFGNIRRLPSEKELARKGGSGVSCQNLVPRSEPELTESRSTII